MPHEDILKTLVHFALCAVVSCGARTVAVPVARVTDPSATARAAPAPRSATVEPTPTPSPTPTPLAAPLAAPLRAGPSALSVSADGDTDSRDAFTRWLRADGYTRVSPNLWAQRGAIADGTWWVRDDGVCIQRELRSTPARRGVAAAREITEIQPQPDGTRTLMRYGFFVQGSAERRVSEWQWTDGSRLFVNESAAHESETPERPDVLRVSASIELTLTGPHVDYDPPHVDARGRTVHGPNVRCATSLALVRAAPGHLEFVRGGVQVFAFREGTTEHWFDQRARCESRAERHVAIRCGNEAPAEAPAKRAR